MEKIAKSFYFHQFILIIFVLLSLELLEQFTRIHIFPFRTTFQSVGGTTLFFLSIYSFSVIMYKKNNFAFSYGNLVRYLLIFSFVGYFSMAISYISIDVISNGIEKYIIKPQLIFMPLILPILPYFLWVGGTLHGLFLFLYFSFNDKR